MCGVTGFLDTSNDLGCEDLRDIVNRMAATLVTISDIIATGESITPVQRERSLIKMTELALESALEINKNL